MLEKEIEKKLIEAVKRVGGIAPKFISPSYDGMPDRIIIIPFGKIAFAELKAPRKHLRPLQEKRKRKLESLGVLVFVIDSVEKIDEVIKEVMK